MKPRHLMPHDPEPKKLFDIAKPGKMLPSSSSRPLITGHHNLLQDPMIKSDEPKALSTDATISEEGPEDHNEEKSFEGLKDRPPIQPGHMFEPTLDRPIDKPAEAAEEPTSDNTDYKDDEDDKPADQPKPDPATHKAAEKTSPSTDDIKYDDLIQQKTYFAPIGTQHQQRSARRWLIITIIVLVAGLLIADLLVDNGTIKTNVRPPIQIFHNNQ